MNSAIMEVNGLYMSWNGHKTLHDINLAVHTGEVVGIIGPNSVGKSSLLKAMLGLVQTDAGEVLIRYKPLAAWDKTKLAKMVAYLAQGNEIHWPLSVRNLVALGRLPHRNNISGLSSQDEDIITRVMQQTGIEHLERRNILHLSGGEQARVLLARALAVQAPLLLADEPVANLDPHYQLSILGLLRQMADTGHSIVIVLHDLFHASRFCDRLYLLGEGRIAARGSPAEVLTPENLHSIYRVNTRQIKLDDLDLPVPWECSE